MKYIKDFPPNYHSVLPYFPTVEVFKPVFCYGDTIYHPFLEKEEIPEDIEAHEQAHCEQQKELGPEAWWTKYCLDKDFRKDQEVEAYAIQYGFVKKHIPQASKEALDDFATALSSPLYGLDITKYQAETLIRKQEKSWIRV